MEITLPGTVKVNVDATMSVNASILRVVVQDEMQSILKLGQRKVYIQWSFNDRKFAPTNSLSLCCSNTSLPLSFGRFDSEMCPLFLINEIRNNFKQFGQKALD